MQLCMHAYLIHVISTSAHRIAETGGPVRLRAPTPFLLAWKTTRNFVHLRYNTILNIVLTRHDGYKCAPARLVYPEVVRICGYICGVTYAIAVST